MGSHQPVHATDYQIEIYQCLPPCSLTTFNQKGVRQLRELNKNNQQQIKSAIDTTADETNNIRLHLLNK